MPIDYKKYPPNWKTEIRPAILERANHCCEFCGVRNHSIGFRKNDVWHEIEQSFGGDVTAEEARQKGFKIVKIVLTIAHLDNNTGNNDFSNLKALCQRCHNRYDAVFRSENRRAKKAKGGWSLF